MQIMEANSKKDRSVAYPSIDLEQALSAARDIKNAFGTGGFSRQDAATALGHENLTGSAARKVAALVHYGLLERTGNAYKLAKPVGDILNPVDEKSKENAIQEAALKPRIFSSIHSEYVGQALPSLLENIVMRKGVTESASRDVVRNFKETMNFSGLLVNGLIMPLDNTVTGDQEGGEHRDLEDQVQDHAAGANTKFDATSKKMDDVIEFSFRGGVILSLPKTLEIMEAIADGELKPVRTAIKAFTDKFAVEKEEVE